jgi:hypothetical protein
MRTLFLTIAVAAVSVAVVAPAGAATKHRHQPPQHAAPAAPVVAPPAFGGPYAPSSSYARPGCYTDEGGGRISPCDHGGGLGGGGM